MSINLVSAILLVAFLIMVILSTSTLLICRVLDGMPDNGDRVKYKRVSLGPVETSYIAILIAWLLFALAVLFLLDGSDKVVISVGIASLIASAMLLMTTSALAFAVIIYKRGKTTKCSNSADHGDGRQIRYKPSGLFFV
jgi:hypothetical protein